MARFYGTIQGNRGEATRLGHSVGGLRVTAQSYSGDVCIQLGVDDQDRDHVNIWVRSHQGGGDKHQNLFFGTMEDLVNGVDNLVKAAARKALEDEHGRA